MRQNLVTCSIALLLLFPCAKRIFAQSEPLLDQTYAGSTMVSGKVAPGQTSLTIYDISYKERVALGTSRSIDKNGNFAVSVSPRLILGHSIVAVDQSGATSQEMVIAVPPSSPTHR
jgi:hypothetical protein